MKYIGQKGTTVEIPFHSPQRVKRCLSFFLPEPTGSWVELEFLRVVWDVCGCLCDEIKLTHVFRRDGRVAHHYEIYFLTGKNLLDPSKVNGVAAQIEEEAMRILKIDLRGNTHANGKGSDFRLPNTKGWQPGEPIRKGSHTNTQGYQEL
jgi:hypothetical protein